MVQRIAVIGSNNTESNSTENEFAFNLGKALVDHGYDIINGGMGGIMEATAKGARTSKKYDRGSMIGFLPILSKSQGNQYSGIQIVSDLGSGRNRFIILNSDAVIAIGGGSGTLNEMSLAWELGKPIAGFTITTGWSAKLAGSLIDPRRSDKVVPITNTHEAISWLKEIL